MKGIPDPTATIAIGNVMREQETDQRASELIHVLKYIIRAAGFELTERVQLRDKKTGRRYL